MHGLGERRITGGALLLAGLAVVGLWTMLGWVVPLILLGFGIVLAWRRHVAGVLACVAGAAALFLLGLTLGWLAWLVGLVLIGMGLGLVAWPRSRLAAGPPSPP